MGLTNMKFLVLSSLLSLTTGQLVTHPNGAVVPADTLAVQAARAAHLTAAGLPLAYAGHPYAAAYHHALGYAAGYPQGLVAHANGAIVPVDEPAVLAAKAEHAAAGGAIAPAAAYAGYPYTAGYPYDAGYAGYPSFAYAGFPGYAGLVAHPNGAVVPAEPADVAAARAEHLAAVAEAANN